MYLPKKDLYDLLVTLKDAITINVKTERENGEFVITKAYFDNDEKATTKKAMLEDGKTEVELTKKIKKLIFYL